MTDDELMSVITAYRATGNPDTLAPIWADIVCWGKCVIRPFGYHELQRLEDPEILSIFWLALVDTISITPAESKAQFLVYYRWVLLQMMVTELSRTKDVPVSRTITFTVRKIERALRQLELAGVPVTDEAIRLEAGLGKRQYDNACQARKLQQMLRLDATVRNEDGEEIGRVSDTIPDSTDYATDAEDDLMTQEIRKEINKALQACSPRQEAIIRLISERGVSVPQAGALLGLSKQEARSAYETGMRRLRQPHIKSKLSKFAGVNLLAATSLTHYRLTGYSSPERVCEDLYNSK